MSTPSNGLRDENDIFGEAEPRVSVEVDRDDPTRDDPTRDMPGETDGRPLGGGVDARNVGLGSQYVSNNGSGVEQPDRD
ncbi:MAG: hypothetical protein WAU42_03170, partial [Solirubrobacteraceae bacterium]